MLRKGLFVAALALTWFVAGDHSPVTVAADTAAKGGNYAHVVIFHLKPDAPEGTAGEMVADCHRLLAKIPSVRGVKAGRPADMVTPDFGKKNYDLALLVLVDDYDGLKTYLDHPLHLKFVEKHLKHIDEDKLLVYDFVNQTSAK